jgi:hypothetical protein
VSGERRLRPPSGMAPPTRASLPDGVVLDLSDLAQEISSEHLSRHPGDVARYGGAIRDWCVHDNQHLLNWAVLDVRGELEFGAQVAWLAGVLGSRGYPLASLADDLQVAADTVRRRVGGEYAAKLAEVLAAGIAFVDC